MTTSTSPVNDFSQRAIDAARDNPAAAALIGAGVFYMLFGTGPLRFGAAAARGGARRAGDAASYLTNTTGRGLSAGYSAVTSGATAGANAVANAARDVVRSVPLSSVQETATDIQRRGTVTAGRAATAVTDRANTLGRSGGDTVSGVQSAISDLWERQPLVLGAVGVLIGGGIAAAFSATQTEKEWLAQPMGAVRADAEALLSAQVDKAADVVGAVRQEAEKQGLTLDAGKRIVTEIKDRVGEVAKSVTTPPPQ